MWPFDYSLFGIALFISTVDVAQSSSMFGGLLQLTPSGQWAPLVSSYIGFFSSCDTFFLLSFFYVTFLSLLDVPLFFVVLVIVLCLTLVFLIASTCM